MQFVSRGEGTNFISYKFTTQTHINANDVVTLIKSILAEDGMKCSSVYTHVMQNNIYIMFSKTIVPDRVGTMITFENRYTDERYTFTI